MEYIAMNTKRLTSLFAVAAVFGAVSLAVPADAGSKHNGQNGNGCNFTNCKTQFGVHNKNVNVDLRLRVIVVNQNCYGQKCSGGAATATYGSFANPNGTGAFGGATADSYAGNGGENTSVGVAASQGSGGGYSSSGIGVAVSHSE
jgi:hypothetical protein